MEISDIILILTFIFGNGITIAIIGYLFRYYENKSKRDFEARRFSREYYMKLYSFIVVFDELIGGYARSLKPGRAELFWFKEGKFDVFTSEEILNEFNNVYRDFSSFYISKKSEGYELFVSRKIKELLINFWLGVKNFYDNNDVMKDMAERQKIYRIVKELTDDIEELFYLKS